ncbi:MAG: beta-eliminating lyase-related protein [Thermoanaerobaculia bacterium]|nr:beta-eliminating lyase-related protein [Thermoanaerobaculia bacterium]
MQSIDLRSDTLTRPDAAMRRAMAEAEVGDDVYGEDPTVRRLEEEAAEALGHEAALFVPSGIMGNQIGVRLICPRGYELLVDERAHIVLFELGATAAIGGIQPRTLPSADGLPALAAFERGFAPRGGYRDPTGAVALENSHNMAGGRVFARARIAAVLDWAAARGVPAHLDGARIWNAATALGTTPAELARGFATVMFCLSKGLGAPVGSLLCSSRDRIAEGREMRRQLGGAMRQVGVLAAAGLVALREGPKRLAEDHATARRLAAALAERPGIEIDLSTIETNIGIFRVLPRGGEETAPAPRFVRDLAAAGVKMSALDDERVRFVTHRDAPPAAVARAIEIVQEMRS